MVDPLILEVYLYKSNYKDRILIGELKEKAQLVAMPNDTPNSFFVRISEVDEILQTKFRKDLLNFAATPRQHVGKSVTSVYFLNSMLEVFPKLRYIKICVSDSNLYSRKVADFVDFSYRVVHSKLDLPEIVGSTDFNQIRRLFIDIGLYKPTKFERIPYIEVYADQLFQLLDHYVANEAIEEGTDEFELIEWVKTLIGPKIQEDGSIVMIIVER